MPDIDFDEFPLLNRNKLLLIGIRKDVVNGNILKRDPKDLSGENQPRVQPIEFD